MTKPILEAAAQEIADATSVPPFLYQLGPEGARKVLDDLQTTPVDKLDVNDKWITVPAEVIIHDFLMLNPVRGTAAATGAVEQAIHVLRKALAAT